MKENKFLEKLYYKLKNITLKNEFLREIGREIIKRINNTRNIDIDELEEILKQNSKKERLIRYSYKCWLQNLHEFY